jgi:pimeloyl-ACP methyl ester carboxylesterase
VNRDELRQSAKGLLRSLRRLEGGDPEKPVPPNLPEGRTVNVDGRGEMFVREIPGPDEPGSPTILLLHGWTLSADLNWFSGGYDVAARHGRVLAPDIRGHGRGLRSERRFTLEAAADDVAALIRQLDAAPAVLVGYSMGGSLALLVAERNPDLVAGLVLASCGLQWRDGLYERVEWMVLGMAEYVLRWGAPSGITDRYLRHAVEQSPELEGFEDWVKAEARRGDPAAIGHAAKALARFDAGALAEGLSVPAAVVITCRDRLIARRHQEAMARALGAHTVEVEGFHNAWMVLPDEWSAAVDHAIALVTSSSPEASGDPTTEGEDRPLQEARAGGG